MRVELCGLTQGMFGWRIARSVTNSRTRSGCRIVAHRRFEMREYHGSIPARLPRYHRIGGLRGGGEPIRQ